MHFHRRWQNTNASIHESSRSTTEQRRAAGWRRILRPSGVCRSIRKASSVTTPSSMIGPDDDARQPPSRHPPTAQRFIKIDDGTQSCALELYLLELGAKKTALGVEDLQKTRIAILIAQRRKPQGSLQRLHLPVLRRLLFPDLSRCNQRIFHFSQTRLYGSEIVVQRLLLLRRGGLDFGAESSRGEDRRGQTAGYLPYPRAAVQPV